MTLYRKITGISESRLFENQKFEKMVASYNSRNTTLAAILNPMHSKELFNSLIKEFVAPFLKREGFKKKALTFYKTQGDIFYLINFQNSPNNSFWGNTFYVNCGINSKEIDKILDRPENDFPPSRICIFNKRINEIAESPHQRFNLSDSENNEDTKIYLMSDLEKLVRFYKSVTSAELIMDNLLHTPGLQQYEEVLIYFLKTKQLNKLNDYAEKVYFVKNIVEDRWIIFVDRINAILNQHGLDIKIEDYSPE